MTAAFAARDNVTGCAWQVEGDELTLLRDAVLDHLDAAHPYRSTAEYAIYTHVSCGEQRWSSISMRWHLYMGCGRAVAAVGSGEGQG